MKLGLLFGLALVVTAYGTNVTDMVIDVANSTDPCEPLTIFKIASCAYRTAEFMEKVAFFDLKKESSLASFHKSCETLKECIHAISCYKNDTDYTEKQMRRMQSLCSGFEFISVDFNPCLQKFYKTNPDSECFGAWSPYLDAKKNMTEISHEEICENFFGTKNCLKKEVTETCSEKEWHQLRDVSVV
ncbi:hypothetical protein B9Z55_017693 [Caenorhabditis nigoni]|uniref:T20D4.11-like domain-containing protein n=1 Tax=Caenorhabditis nigoni TaxID=1611254 RepID=A0A2G5TAK8_9PELO|nr:hypothetical protein B9Z55_017693 [Caenorhabditis nigoni]